MREPRAEPEEIRLSYVPLSEIKRWPRNPKKHDAEAIDDSIERFGYVLPMVRDERSGRLVAGHGRLEVLVQKKADGKDPPRRIKLRRKDGEWLVPVLDGISFANEAEAEAYLLADNRLVEKGGWDAQLIADIFGDLDEEQQQVTGWDEAEVERLLVRETLRTSEDPPVRRARQPRPFTGIAGVTVHLGDASEVLPGIGDSMVDSLVTDPPAGIAFMGEAWDKDKGGRDAWVAWLTGIMRECLRVMKPGAHALVWALPRTSHWTATALEDAGFEIRDVVVHLFGQGFPKSLDASKAIVDRLGARRKPVRLRKDGPSGTGVLHSMGMNKAKEKEYVETAPASDLAKKWDGYGTALKPSSEHWILVRKPLEGTLAQNLEKWGVGALDIDGGRIGEDLVGGSGAGPGKNGSWNPDTCGFKEGNARPAVGRWPGNVVLSHAPECTEEACAPGCRVRELDEEGGSPSRFFYVPKPSPREKNEGLDEFPVVYGSEAAKRKRGSAGADHPRAGTGRLGAANTHPTVKPVALMRHFVRLITPPGGLVLDPFCGSGTTGIACLREGARFVGIEQDVAFREIAVARMKAAAGSK